MCESYADWEIDQALAYDEYQWFAHMRKECGGIMDYCPFCIEKQLEIEEAFRPWIATGGNHNPKKGD